MKNLLFKCLAEFIGPLLGRRNLVRLGSFIYRAGALDYPNSIAGNGESLVQRAILIGAESDLVVIDCGANMGQWSSSFLLIAETLGSKNKINLICFEPSAYTYDILCKNCISKSTERFTIYLERAALSNESGEVLLSIVHEGAGVNSIVEVPNTFASQEAVSRITLEKYAEGKSIASIDLLKIDAEGHDLDVMLGAESLLKSRSIKMVQFEYNWRWIYAGHFLRNAFELLECHGYELFKITPIGLVKLGEYGVSLETYVEGNYLACLPEYVSEFQLV